MAVWELKANSCRVANLHVGHDHREQRIHVYTDVKEVSRDPERTQSTETRHL